MQRTTCNAGARESLTQPHLPDTSEAALETPGHSKALPAALLAHGAATAHWSCAWITLIMLWLIINPASVRFGGEETFSFCRGEREMMPLNSTVCINDCAFYPEFICRVLWFGRSLCEFWCVKQGNGFSLLKGLQIGWQAPGERSLYK